MRVFVCVKQVPDTSGKVVVKEDGTLDRVSMSTIINPDDLSAVEAALQMKDKGLCTVTVVTMGPMLAEGMLMELLAMGADDAVLISSREFGGSDTFATSQILAAALHHVGIGENDMVFCGNQAIDGDTAQVGPQLAEKLNFNQVTYALNIKKENETVTVKRLYESGYMNVETRMPCLITFVKEAYSPRYMNVLGIMGCRKKPMLILDYNSLSEEALIDKNMIGLKGSPTNIFKSFTVVQKKSGLMLKGNEEEMAGQLAEILMEKNII